MKTRYGSSNGAFVLGVDGLIAFGVPVFDVAELLELVGEGGMAKAADVFVELFVGAVEEETDGAAAGGGIVDDFGNKGFVGTEIEFVADTDFAGGVDDDVPETHFLVELTLEEDGDFGTGFFLFAIEQGREDLGVICHDDIAGMEIIEEVFEKTMLDVLGVAVENHEAGFVALLGGLLCNEVLGQDKIKVGKFHFDDYKNVQRYENLRALSSFLTLFRLL